MPTYSSYKPVRSHAKPPKDMSTLRMAILPLLILFCIFPPIGFARYAWNASQVSIVTSAAKNGDLAKLKAMVKADKQYAEAKGYLGRTPLWWATARGRTEVITYLVKDAKVDIDVKDSRGWTPLFAAAAHNQKDALETLVDLGANRSLTDTAGGTALHAAATGYNPATAEVLTNIGLSVDAADAKGMTPLHIAIQHKNGNMVKTLIGLQANVNAKAKDGTTPLAMANRQHRGQDIASDLIDAGAKE